MKQLNQFITEYIIKKKLDKAIDSEYKYHPQTKEELIKNIEELIQSDTYDFNCIDTSAITDMSHLFEHIDIDRNKGLEPLFKNEKEYDDFIERHNKNSVKSIDISQLEGNVYLGIDAGSTTTTAAIIDENSNLLYTHYSSNEGSPLETSIKVLKEIYKVLPKNCKILSSCVTGYGEALLKKALNSKSMLS